MPGAAIVAAALTDHSSHPYGLFVGGVDVIREPGTSSRYATPIDSIHVEEQGPDDVSSMDFTIECTTALPISVTEGMDVRFEQVQGTAYTFFRGWVDHVDIENMDGDVGTRFRVRCTGIEAVLDWSVMPNDVVIPAGTLPADAVQALVGQAYGTALGIVRAFGDGSGSSTQAGPIAQPLGGTVLNAVTVSAGTTLREAIRQVSLQSFAPFLTTVDFWGGLRVYLAATGVADLVTMTIDDDPPLLGVVAESLQYGIDAAQYRAVIVKGTGVTVTVGDGSGKPGPAAVLSDSTITTVAAAQQAGSGYLSQYASSARGQFALTDSSSFAGTQAHTFSWTVTFSDARVGFSSTLQRITTVSWSFTNADRQDLAISFGGPAPSMVGLARQLTRNVLS